MKNLLLLLLVSCTIYAQDPVVINDAFSKIPKNSGSDCSCAGWINKDLGDQAESSTLSATPPLNDAIKFDNLEADIMYQEVEVLPNTNYKLTYSYRVSGDATGTSELEIRILAGTGYTGGYVPSYPSETDPIPTFGYTDITVVENTANNLASVIESFPGTDDYFTKSLDFNSGANTSIALFARGIGNPTTPPVDMKPYTWSSGDQETRLDFITLTNETALSITEQELTDDISFFPNPTNNVININSKNDRISSIEVIDPSGKILLQKNNNLDVIDLTSLSTGLYYMNVYGDGAKITKPVMKN